MTAFFGVASPEGEPLSMQGIQAMQAPLIGHEAGPVALHCQPGFAAGALVQAITPEDLGETQPLRDGPHVLVARARLDNRDELRAALGISPQAAGADSRLVLAAYRRWGRDCVEHLQGDWVFALWDAGRGQLLLARDATGNSGLYWARHGKALLFATSIKCILAYPGWLARPNPQFVAGVLTVFRAPSQRGETAYAGIERLLPGHSLVASIDGIRRQRWWRPEELAPLQPRSSAEHLAEFLSLYESAVGARLRSAAGPIALALSGGLDSTSVAALAAPALARRQQRLAAYVHCPMHTPPDLGPHHHGDELSAAREAAAHIGDIDVHALRSENTSVLQGLLAALQTHDAPLHAASNQFWIIDLLRSVRASGARVLLTGQGGNATISYSGSGNLLPQLRDGQLTRTWSALRDDQTGLRTALKRRIAKPLVIGLRERLAGLPGPRRAEPWSAYSVIAPGFARELDLVGQMRAADHDPSFGPRHGEGEVMRKFRLGTLRGGVAGTQWMESATAYGLDIRDPTFDRRIVEFCWRTPDSFFWADGRQRGLVRAAFAQRLPASILYPRQRGMQSADLALRLAAQREELEAALAGLDGNALSRAWLDLPRMRRMLADICRPDNPSRRPPASSTLMRGLGVGLFLARF